MDIFNLLTRMENLDDLCIICGFPNEKHTEENYRGGPCPLKAAIDDLRSGRLAVVDKHDESVCPWTAEHDPDGEPHYATSCGGAFIKTDGNLEDNDLRYCAFCGKKIVEIKKEQVND